MQFQNYGWKRKGKLASWTGDSLVTILTLPQLSSLARPYPRLLDTNSAYHSLGYLNPRPMIYHHLSRFSTEYSIASWTCLALLLGEEAMHVERGSH